MTATTMHPRRDDNGRVVPIWKPSLPTPVESWVDPRSVATVIPDGPMVPALNGIDFAPWLDHPRSHAEWQAVAGQLPDLQEPPLAKKLGYRLAAGVVIEEADGRIWLMSPSNQHGGYINTFPKGTIEHGLGPQATAIREVFEESGLQVVLTGYLMDVYRTRSVSRYYTGRRVGGNPAAMGWESQAVHLIPKAKLSALLLHPTDAGLLAALTGTRPPP